MNWDIIEGKWEQFKSDVKSRWAKLTDDDLGMIAAKRDKLIGKIQERYGVVSDDAEREVDDWLEGLGDSASSRKKSDQERHIPR